jgi:predicted dienelactone hydrolase
MLFYDLIRAKTGKFKGMLFGWLAFFMCLFAMDGFSQQSPPFHIGQRTRQYQDASRNRPLKTEIWYPTADAYPQAEPQPDFPFIVPPTIRDAKLLNRRFPLVLISHGTGGGRITLAWMATALAQQGYVVAAVDHWGNTYDNKTPEGFLKNWNRPLDISFVLTQLLQDASLSKMIDPQKVGALGFSIGGYTVIALAGGEVDYNALQRYIRTPQGRKEVTVPEFPQLASLVNDPTMDTLFRNIPPLKDKRIKAVFALSPAIGQGFSSSKQVKQIDIPVSIVGAESDSITPYQTNALHYHKLLPNSEYYLVKGKVGHYIFLNEAKEGLKNEMPLIYADDPSISRRQIHEQVAQQAVNFFGKTLK